MKLADGLAGGLHQRRIGSAALNQDRASVAWSLRASCGLSDDRLKLDEPEDDDDVAVALARPAHGPQAVEDGGALRHLHAAARTRIAPAL